MSDDDRDIDIESDEEDEDGNSLGASANTQFMTPAEKRAHHNALERKRRDHIKESFSGLRDCVPSLHSEKASRAQILKQATDYIQFMTKKNSSIQTDIDELKRQNHHLDMQVRSLEKASSTGAYALSSSSALNVKSNFDGGSESETSDSEPVPGPKRKKLKAEAN